jgi:hypothetical protein
MKDCPFIKGGSLIRERRDPLLQDSAFLDQTNSCTLNADRKKRRSLFLKK